MAAPEASSNLTGVWKIDSGPNSFAGYRVDEVLSSFGSRTAVGRTTAVQGYLVYDGQAITGVQVSADLTGLKSDQSLRDDTLKMQGIQSCRFPGATFSLITPIAISTTSGDVAKTVQGNLTLHGVTRPVSVDVKGRLQGGTLTVVGSTTIQFGDYAIPQPRSFLVVSLEDHGIMEFQLTLTKSASATPPALPSVTAPQGCGAFQGPPPGGGGGGGPPP